MNQIIIKSVFLFAIILIQFFHEGFAQATFQKTYGGGGTDIGDCVRQLNDGGFVVAGTTNSFLETGGGIYVVRTDASGDTLWTRTYGGANNWEHAACIIQAADGGLVMVGSASSFGHGQEDVYVVKTDISGAIQWSVTIGDSLNERANWIDQTSSGNYIITGFTRSFDAGEMVVYLILIDSTGNLVWTKTYKNYPGNNGKFVKQTNDGGFVILCEIMLWDGQGEVMVIKTDSMGNTIWAKSFDGIQANSLIETPDSSFVFTGSILGNTNNLLYLYKIGSDGSFSWGKTYNVVNGNTVLPAADGGYWLLGADDELIKTDQQGNVEWARKSGNLWSQIRELNMCLTNNHDLVITGSKYLFDQENDLLLFRTDTSRNGSCTDVVMNVTATDYIPQIDNQNLVESSGGSASLAPTHVNNVNTTIHTWTLPVASFSYFTDTTSLVRFYNYSQNYISWKWDFGDGNVDSTQNFVYHIYSDTGTYNVCLTVTNNCGSDEYCHPVTISAPGAVEELNPVNIKIYPNPAKEYVTIQFADHHQSYHPVSIYNEWGICVYHDEHVNSNSIEIDRNMLPSNGIYFVRVTDNRGFAGVAKFIFE